MRITEQDWRGIVNRRKDHIAPIICEVMSDSEGEEIGEKEISVSY